MPNELFGQNITPACRYCEFSMQILASGDVLCSRRGIVAADYSCRKYEYDPLIRIPRKPPQLPAFSQEEFSLEPVTTEGSTQ